MRAATHISHGAGVDRAGDPVLYEIAPGEAIPSEILDDIPPEMILENLAETSPEDLTRDQLMVLAGLAGPDAEAGDDEGVVTMEYNEEDLRTALGEMNRKSDIIDWWNMIRPEGPEINDRDTRGVIEDWVVNQLMETTELEEE